MIERLDIKQDLYRKLDAVRKPGTPISSNTSTIPLGSLIEGMPDAFAKDFMITHFFNPPRYMRLLEIVAGPKSDPALVDKVKRFADVAMGKSIVACKDSPGFIANRLGIYWMQCGILDAIDNGLGVEEADAVMGRPFGIPKTGIFGLIDLVGIDLGPHINASLAGLLPKSDAFHSVNRDVPLIGRMIKDGYTGRKGKGGFYRIDKSKGRKDKQAIDLQSGEYAAAQSPEIPRAEKCGEEPARPDGVEVQGRPLRLDRDGAHARLCRRPRAGGRRRDRRDRRGHAARLQLEGWSLRADRQDRPRLVRQGAEGRGAQRAADPGEGGGQDLLPARERQAAVLRARPGNTTIWCNPTACCCSRTSS